jgi:mannonate dehydratase
MGKLGIGVLCYNFMHVDWTRTDFQIPARGGAMTNGFDLAKIADRAAPARPITAPQRLWDNLGYFLKRIVPVAEDAGVNLAMHPDDPPIASVSGAAQIMYDADCFERLFDLAPSKANGMCFCQGTFSEMGVDIPSSIKRLADRIHYVHFRDVRGKVPSFVGDVPRRRPDRHGRGDARVQRDRLHRPRAPGPRAETRRREGDGSATRCSAASSPSATCAD